MNHLLSCGLATIVSAALLSAPMQRAVPAPAAPPRGNPGPHQGPDSGNAIIKVGLFDWLFGGGGREEETRRPRPDAMPDRDNDNDETTPPRHEGGTYRTVCVRLCDGFYFPISFATTRDRFAEDAKQCERSCPTRSRLFVYHNPGEAVENMVDLEGHPYKSLPNAFRHLSQYVADCTCQGNPWDAASLARHKGYAEAAKQNATDKDKVARQQPSTQTQPPRATRQSRWYERRRWRDGRGENASD